MLNQLSITNIERSIMHLLWSYLTGCVKGLRLGLITQLQTICLNIAVLLLTIKGQEKIFIGVLQPQTAALLQNLGMIKYNLINMAMGNRLFQILAISPSQFGKVQKRLDLVMQVELWLLTIIPQVICQDPGNKMFKDLDLSSFISIYNDFINLLFIIFCWN